MEIVQKRGVRINERNTIQRANKKKRRKGKYGGTAYSK